jgi:hypothetical protein
MIAALFFVTFISKFTLVIYLIFFLSKWYSTNITVEFFLDISIDDLTFSHIVDEDYMRD